MIHNHTTLPSPSAEAHAHSQRVLSLLVEKLTAMPDDSLSFAAFMQHCLYHPGLGYYSAGLPKIGRAGDFVTAPEISPLFSYSLANHFADVLKQLPPTADCLEFGAGRGTMAADMLLHLASIDCLPRHYYILETSADLRQRQQDHLQTTLGALAEKVIWLETLPEHFTGVIVANEICDAMPVHQVVFTEQQVLERCVRWQNDQLTWHTREISNPVLRQHCEAIAGNIPCKPFICEINLFAEAWIQSLAASLQQGAIFILDYGHSDAHYFQASRQNGSIRCHYQHHVHDDPLQLIGLQDITAHVAFTALAETAFKAGLNVSGYQHQNDFLIAGDLISLTENQDLNTLQQLQSAAALKRLLLPEQMGETFKVLTLTQQIDYLPRLQRGDLRHQL